METEKQKTISVTVLESLTSSIGAILGVKQQLYFSSPASWDLVQPGWQIQIKHEPWYTCNGGPVQTLQLVTSILIGLYWLSAACAVMVMLGDDTGEHAT